MQIGRIGNHYGTLHVKVDGEKFFWGIEDWDGIFWEEISEELYKMLVKHEKGIPPIK